MTAKWNAAPRVHVQHENEPKAFKPFYILFIKLQLEAIPADPRSLATLGPCALASSCSHDVVTAMRTTALLRKGFTTEGLPQQLCFSLLRGLFHFFSVCGLFKTSSKFHQGIEQVLLYQLYKKWQEMTVIFTDKGKVAESKCGQVETLCILSGNYGLLFLFPFLFLPQNFQNRYCCYNQIINFVFLY